MANITATCRFCGKVFIDPKKTSMREPDAQGKHVYSFDCPLCGTSNLEEISLNKAMLMVLSGMTATDGVDPKDLLSKGLELAKGAGPKDGEHGSPSDEDWFGGVYKFDLLN